MLEYIFQNFTKNLKKNMASNLVVKSQVFRRKKVKSR